MDTMQIINMRELSSSTIEEKVKKYETALTGSFTTYKKNFRINRIFNISFTILSIVLTMATGILAVFDEAGKQKIWVGILASASVAVQTAAKQFPVAERAKLYLKLQNAVSLLNLTLSSAEKDDDLKPIKEAYDKILGEETLAP
jgi:CHASE1-domain containing sensor protein